MTGIRRNRLASEASPYLQQHASNPVDWYPWGDEAFERAVRENKPVFLSIGYATCHWCHVMERESFEDIETAKVLNEHFVSIKVDREERPDVDRAYMAFVQASTGGGGWPLNVFLTPERKPFYGGTYYPPVARHGRRSFRDILGQIADVWRKQPHDVIESAKAFTARLDHALNGHPGHQHNEPWGELLERAAKSIMGSFDATYGGFGGAPKFPTPSVLKLLLHYSDRSGALKAREMVEFTSEKMATGGIFDHLGGGFSRYSVDAQWRVPHFEKMLYDNAQLATIYLQLHALTGNFAHAEVARSIFDYVLRDMRHPLGGFFSAEDADSEGHEGKFYCWTKEELEALLSPEQARVACAHFGVTPTGNFVDHSHPAPLEGQNVLAVVAPVDGADRELLATAKEKLLEVRAQRVRPLRDEKILASWNGMMLEALAHGFGTLGETRLLDAAEKCLSFLQAHLWDSQQKRLHHRWRDGERDSVQLLAAYSYVLQGVLSLYEVTLKEVHLRFAIELADSLVALFEDRKGGGFWPSTSESELYLRTKEDHDGAEPTASSVATFALARLAAITGRTEFQQSAQRGLESYREKLAHAPHALSNMLCAADFIERTPLRIVFTGPHELSPEWRNSLAATAVTPRVILGQDGPVEDTARNLPSSPNTMAFVCTSDRCLPAVSTPRDLASLLSELRVK